MVEIQAKVVGKEAGFVWIASTGMPLCSQCNPETGCKSIAITRLFCRKPPLFRVRDPLGVNIGDKVTVGIEEKALLNGAIIGYGFPILGLIGGAMMGLLLGGEYLSVIGAAIGFLTIMLRLKKKKISLRDLPVVLGRVLTDT